MYISLTCTNKYHFCSVIKIPREKCCIYEKTSFDINFVQVYNRSLIYFPRSKTKELIVYDVDLYASLWYLYFINVYLLTINFFEVFVFHDFHPRCCFLTRFLCFPTPHLHFAMRVFASWRKTSGY